MAKKQAKTYLVTLNGKNRRYTRSDLERWHKMWKNGKVTKAQLEREKFGVHNARSKYITRLWENADIPA